MREQIILSSARWRVCLTTRLIRYLLCFGLLITGCASSPTASRQEGAAGLSVDETTLSSVIVTATDTDTAARLVTLYGGTMTSRLWLIDAVGAQVPTANLPALTADPRVVSVVQNQHVQAAVAV